MQVAPFDTDYWWRNASATFHSSEAVPNACTGSAYQEAVSTLSPIMPEAYVEHPLATYTTFGAEITPDWDLNGGGRKYHMVHRRQANMDGAFCGRPGRSPIRLLPSPAEPFRWSQCLQSSISVGPDP